MLQKDRVSILCLKLVNLLSEHVQTMIYAIEFCMSVYLSFLLRYDTDHFN